METTTTAPRRDAPAGWPPRMENAAHGHALAFFETHESGGGRTLMQLEVAPGGWIGTHAHRAYDETFTCVEGCLTVTVAGFPYELRPGQEVTAAAGIHHAWSNDGPRRALALVELRPGHAGAETALRVLYGLAGEGRLRPDGTPRNLLHLALVTGWAQARLAGIRGALTPLLPALAALARLRGVDRELIARSS
jgi:mannose-6-phosphate isomerase-like protein (cupin superfamily)